MNHVLNDRGETIIAVGAPGSVERAKVEYPVLIEELSAMRDAEARGDGFSKDDSAVTVAAVLHSRGILVGCGDLEKGSVLAMRSLLDAAGFNGPQSDEIFGQLQILNQDKDRELRKNIAPLTQAPSVGPSPVL